LAGLNVFSQIYPVQASAQLIPPHSGYLPDYADPSSEKLKVILQFNDFTVSQYNIRLKIEIKGNGFSLTTKPFFNPPPLALQPGVPLLLSGTDLAPYLNSTNLDFSGLNLAQYEQKMALPEGFYSICIKAYDYYNSNNIQVSNEACAQAWFTYSDPPFLNFPLCNKVITPQIPQNIIFQWTPINLGSPNSALNTEYEFALWEMRPDSNANPNQVVLNTAPVFSTTTNHTTFNYGITETPLNLYMKYAWKVRARDITGRDWFKNNGWSQICTFTYGDPKKVLGDAIGLTLTAQGISHRLGLCNWNKQSLFTKYTLQVRKQGTNNWFDYPTTEGSEKITNLEPSTDYEARVRGGGNGLVGDWSNTAPFKTLPEPLYACNDQTQYADVLAAKPLPLEKALPGLIIQSGQFEVVASSMVPNGMPGWYGGKGYATVFGKRVPVKFDNIFINDNNRHLIGNIEAVTKGIKGWLSQWDVKEAQENATYVNAAIDSIYFYNGKICITTKNGIECFDFPEDANVLVIRDEEGNEYIVTPPDKIAGPNSYFKISDEVLSASDSVKVVFEASAAQQFGFDKKEQAAWHEQYEIIKLVDKKYYFVANKSIGKDQSDEAIAVLNIKNFNASWLSFKTKNELSVNAVSVGNNQYKLSGIPHDAQCVYAWYDGKKIGKLNVISLEQITKKLVLVPVGNANAPSAENLKNALSDIFKQANVKWEVSAASKFNTTSWDVNNNGLDAADATLMSKYSPEMRALRDAYRKADSAYNKSAYYLFVVNNFSDPLQKGYMVRGRACGFMSSGATPKEVAHELAHGAFGLEHTFPKVKQGISSNLMDYGTGTTLTKKQWEDIHSSFPVFNWMDDEEDAAFFSTEYFSKYAPQPNSIVGDGYVPRWLWDNTTSALSGFGTVCGVIDGLCGDLEGLADVAKFMNCWNFLNSGNDPTCVEVRQKTIESGGFILKLAMCQNVPALTYYTPECLAVNQQINEQFKNFVNDGLNLSIPEQAYVGGKTVYFVASFFIGVGEVSATLKSAGMVSKLGRLAMKAKTFAAPIKSILSSGIRVTKAAGFALLMKGNTVFAKVSSTGTFYVTKVIEATQIKKVIAKLPKKEVIFPGKTTAVEQEVEIVESLNGEIGVVEKVEKIYKNVTLEEFAKTITGATLEQKQLAYTLWGEEKWEDLYKLFNPTVGIKINDGWPPFYGVKSVIKKQKGKDLVGKTFDRFQNYDNLGGYYASPVYSGEKIDNLIFTYDSRALKDKIQEGTRYVKFRLKETVTNNLEFEFGEAIPWFKVQGNGDQVRSNLNFNELKKGLDYEIIELMKFENGKWIKVI